MNEFKERAEDRGNKPDLATPDRGAENFRHTRNVRKTEIAEDYVELIADLIDSSGEARAVDIARRLGVSHATVIKTTARLQRDGLVVTQPYRAIFLTPGGGMVTTAPRDGLEVPAGPGCQPRNSPSGH